MIHIIAYIIAGLIAGFVASKIVNKSGEGLILDIILGLVGGVVGGWLVRFFFPTVSIQSGLHIASIVVAIIGAVVLLLIYHGIRKLI